MHHEVVAPAAGVVREIALAPGRQVEEGEPLFTFEAAADGAPAAAAVTEGRDLDAVREDLARVRERAGRQRRRPARRRGAAPRDRPADRARERRGPVDDGHVGSTARSRSPRSGAAHQRGAGRAAPADGIVCGDRHRRRRRARRARLRLHRVRRHAGDPQPPQARPDARARRAHRMPVVLFAEGGGGRPGDIDRRAIHLDMPTFLAFARLRGLVPRVGSSRDAASPATPRCSAAATSSSRPRTAASAWAAPR